MKQEQRGGGGRPPKRGGGRAGGGPRGGAAAKKAGKPKSTKNQMRDLQRLLKKVCGSALLLLAPPRPP